MGFAAVEYDDGGWPIRILAAVSHLHDGGMDPNTAKTPKTRLATAGVARRTRRLIRNRRRRLRLLDQVLLKHGLPVPEEEVPQTHAAWLARARLVEEVVADPAERDALISLAVRHLARHRGWRNPWWTAARLAEAPVPSDAFAKTLEEAHHRFPGELGHVHTMGQLVGALAGKGIPIRPTKNAQANPEGPVMSHQVRQEDSRAELQLILSVQGVADDAANTICDAVFFQAKPRIPKDRIGTCALQPDLPRAPLASLEFQEFRVRQKAADLRMRSGNAKRPLTAGEYDAVVAYLLGYRDEIRPRWRDVADHLGVGARNLVDDSQDGSGGTFAPIDRTSAKVEQLLPVKGHLAAWWHTATAVERSELIVTITDLSGDDGELSSDVLATLLGDPENLERLDKVNSAMESGRAMYSVDTLARLNAVMRERRCDVHAARKIAFGVDDTWQPPRPTFDDPIEHPTLNRVNTLVRRFLMTAVDKWGVPESVVVEHVRNAFAGPAALAEIRNEIRMNTNRREGVAQSLRAQGIADPNRRDIKKNECVGRQNCVCLYCGTTITLLTCELDHILPRARGGSSRRDNLAAVCRPCNAAKGKLSFPAFAMAATNPEITLEAATLRVKDWNVTGMSRKAAARLKADVVRRLALTEDDETDERSLASTAYAAREMRARIETFLDQQVQRRGGSRGSVMVFAGVVTSEARKAGGVDDRIRLREFTRKSRLDRRHHAIDATVLTSLDLGVAKTLSERAAKQRDNSYVQKDMDWKDYRGATPGAQQTFARWAERIRVLAALIEQAIADDNIPVVRQLRLSPRVGSVHADTIEPLIHKDIADAFSRSEVLRVVNTSLFMKLSELAAGGDLGQDPGRSQAMKWAPDRPVALYPSNAAYLPVRGGAAAIGGTIRWAQVYAWRTKSGFDFGMIRLYAGELHKIGFATAGTDFLRTLPPPSSQAMRVANSSLLKKISAGEARLVNWIALDDEVEFDANGVEARGTSFGNFLAAMPEHHWYVVGFEDARRINIRPSLLSREGVDEGTPPAVRQLLEGKAARLSINDLLRLPGCRIIRRTITGAPRWTSDALPVSWSPREAAEQAFIE